MSSEIFMNYHNAKSRFDLAIEKCYRNKPFASDDECLEYLFKMYEEMINSDGNSAK